MSHPMFRCVVLTLAGLLASARSQAADQPPPVNMIVTVEAGNGGSLPALKESDVIATQGGKRLRVTGLTACQGENAAMELFLVLDDASSPSGWRLDDLRRFIDSQPATASIGIGHMHNGMVETTVKLTLDHALVAQSLRLPLGAGAASPYLALSDFIKHWQGHADRREVVMITSGIDPTGGNGPVNPYLDTAIADAQRQGSRMPRKAAVSAGRDRVTVRRPISIEKTLIRRRLIVEREIGASDRARTGDIQNHNLAL